MGPRPVLRAASRLHTCSVGCRDLSKPSLGLPMGPFLSPLPPPPRTIRAGQGCHRARLSVPSFLPQDQGNGSRFFALGSLLQNRAGGAVSAPRSGWSEDSASSPALKLSVPWDWEFPWRASLGLPQSFPLIWVLKICMSNEGAAGLGTVLWGPRCPELRQHMAHSRAYRCVPPL